MKKINILLLSSTLIMSPSVFGQDSTKPRPNSSSGNFSVGKLEITGGNLTPGKPTGETVTEYKTELCPAGLKGAKGLNTFVVSQKHVTTYRLNGHVVGVTETDWEDVDEDCTGMEEKILSCPVNQIGENIVGRRVVTDDNGQMQYGLWNELRNTCDYYKIKDDNESRSLECGSGMEGVIKESRNFELWSDNSHRNVGIWNVISNNCKTIPTIPVNPFPKGLEMSLSGNFEIPNTNYMTLVRLNVGEEVDIKAEAINWRIMPKLDNNKDFIFEGYEVLSDPARLAPWNDPNFNINIKTPNDLFMHHMVVSFKEYREDDYEPKIRFDFYGYKRSNVNNIYKIGTVYPMLFYSNIRELIEDGLWPYPY